MPDPISHDCDRDEINWVPAAEGIAGSIRYSSQLTIETGYTDSVDSIAVAEFTDRTLDLADVLN